MWGIPTDELGFSKFWTHFLRHANIMPWDGFSLSEGTYLEKARNQIHKGFVSGSKMPLLMMLDSDILFPPLLVETLIAHKLPIVGGWYRDKKAEDHHQEQVRPGRLSLAGAPRRALTPLPSQ